MNEEEDRIKTELKKKREEARKRLRIIGYQFPFTSPLFSQRVYDNILTYLRH